MSISASTQRNLFAVTIMLTTAALFLVAVPQTASAQQWEQVKSVSESVSCSVGEGPNREPEDSVIYNANGNAEKVRVVIDASASHGTCPAAGLQDSNQLAAVEAPSPGDGGGDDSDDSNDGDGGSGDGGGGGSNQQCKADARAQFDVTSLSDNFTFSVSANTSGDSSDSRREDNVYDNNPTGEVSIQTHPYNIHCSSDFEVGSGASWSITVYEPANEEPVAVDDGNNETKICSGDGDPINIDVLNNDYDPDGDNDNLSITDVANPNNGTAIIAGSKSRGGDQWIRYTPGSETGEVNFGYTITDGTDTDNATVSVDVASGKCGKATIKTEDQNGNPVDADELGFKVVDGNNEETFSGSGNSFTLHNLKVTDDPKEVITGNSYVSDSEYEVDFFNKKTDGNDGHPNDPTRSQIGF